MITQQRKRTERLSLWPRYGLISSAPSLMPETSRAVAGDVGERTPNAARRVEHSSATRYTSL